MERNIKEIAENAYGCWIWDFWSWVESSYTEVECVKNIEFTDEEIQKINNIAWALLFNEQTEDVKLKINEELNSTFEFLKEYCWKNKDLEDFYLQILKRDNSEEFEAWKIAWLKFALSLLDKKLDK